MSRARRHEATGRGARVDDLAERYEGDPTLPMGPPGVPSKAGPLRIRVRYDGRDASGGGDGFPFSMDLPGGRCRVPHLASFRGFLRCSFAPPSTTDSRRPALRLVDSSGSGENGCEQC
jgi:hypothetical protein